MAIYSTFFLSNQEDLLSGFPGWRLPLAQPVLRQFTNPFTQEILAMETRQPEWTGDEAEPPESDEPATAADSVSYDGYRRLSPAARRDFVRSRARDLDDYKDFLEERLPPFVQGKPHRCAKGLTSVELGLLGKAIGHDPGLADALFCPPRLNGGMIQQFRSDFVAALASIDNAKMEAAAKCLAEVFAPQNDTRKSDGTNRSDHSSTPTGTGRPRFFDWILPGVAHARKRAIVRGKVQEAGRISYAKEIVQALSGLAAQREGAAEMYLLIEA